MLGTSAPILANPSLTDFLSTYPIWPIATASHPASTNDDSESPSLAPSTTSAQPRAGTALSFKRGRGRPPKPRKKRQVQPKARTRKKTPTRATESEVPTAPRYQLRNRRQPRYKCGTCGLRDCVCVLAAIENRGILIEVRRVPLEEGGTRSMVYRLTVRAEKTYSAVERTKDHPVDTTLQKLSSPGVANDPCPRCKDGTSDGKDLEFTLATVVPPVPGNIVFGPFSFEREPVQIARCITADLLDDKFGVHVEPGGVYSPAQYWWLLVTAPRVDALVVPSQLLA